MPEANKQLIEDLTKTIEGMPDDVQANLLKNWTAEADGAKKVCDMMASTTQPG